LLVIVSPAIPMVDYVINYKHISEDLCVNKDKPEMHCNGKCHLKKEIKKVLGDDNPGKKKNTIPTLKLKEYTDYYRLGMHKKYYQICQFAEVQNVFLTQKTFKGFLPSLIKPPPVILFI